ncbi:DUF2935 domain-containing protein [Gorillibacterium sp. sgz5001074]|uniref:DUF2935 domain-containing protein n=1 Tax=Gorillibacterium sp. sgz5001074 TaxID=3446695 RepID=UPI003F66E15F
MTPPSYFTPWEEHRFWLEILQDHAYFVYNALSPSDVRNVQTAAGYIQAFGDLLEQLLKLDPRLETSDPSMIQLARSAQPVAYGYFQFEGQMQHLRIENRIELNLTPTYMNGTGSENAEYLRLLSSYMAGQQPAPLSLADLVDLWLEDQLGHASLLINHLDVAELGWIEKVQRAQTTFSALMIKQRQIRKYLRFTPPNFPVQLQFAEDIAAAVTGFEVVVRQVVQLLVNQRVLSRLSLRFIEHHFPESCYFLRKLSLYVPHVPVRDCSLTKPSFTPSAQTE